jgi:hypothetical protein
MTEHHTLDRLPPEPRVPEPADTGAALVELLCADSELLRVEFDAIIAASFPPGDGQRSRIPPRRPARCATDRPAAPSAGRPTGAARGQGRARRAAAAAPRARERSPPVPSS